MEEKNRVINDCLEVRDFLMDAVRKELIGPGSETVGPELTEEIITESPQNRYTIGMLFPQSQIAEEDTILEEGNTVTNKVDIDEIPDEYISLANQYYPSAMGMSFYASGICPSLIVELTAAKYRKMTDDDECIVFLENIPENAKKNERFISSFRCEDGRIMVSAGLIKKDRNYFLNLSDDMSYQKAIHKLKAQASYGWKRVPLPKEQYSVNIPEDKNRRFEKELVEGLILVCIRRPEKDKQRTLFTVSVLNNFKSSKQMNAEETFFQVGFKVSFIKKRENVFLEYDTSSTFFSDAEINSYRLLYRNRKEFATGHGCAVGWSVGDDTFVKELYTETIPFFEVPHIGFNVSEINEQVPEILFMNNLSNVSSMSDEDIIASLYKFCRIYKDWIDKLLDKVNKLSSELHETARSHINQCEETFKRMKEGVELLEGNSMVLKAFRLANRAMFMQCVHSELQKSKRFPEDGSFELVDYSKYKGEYRWRPFQLAFFLLCLKSIHSHSSSERKIVDLIWFATAGGKTEAYLGITAFAIFLRRLNYRDKGGGTAVIMRYTLRLLASQQFQRATTLICACEIIRKEMEHDLGKEKISIGLWVGSSLTPNSRQKAREYVNSLQRGRTYENPFQLFGCPWCGTKLVKEGNKGQWGYRMNDRPLKFIIFCTEEKCEFSEELPISVVDEDIYAHPPTLLFGTVDKFALIPWKAEVSNIFALNQKNNNPSPELIIQDELHLIEGPLGTIVGLYETAIDILCSAKGIKPKIIASTATIRRAAEQCLALYDRKVKLFPPPGLSVEDSFFAREIPVEEKPGRLFIGIMSSGRTHTTTIIRFMATILQAVKVAACEDRVKDPYWTLVGYYNTLRELGHNVTLVNQDVNDYLIDMAKRCGVDYRRLYEPIELTSRIGATQIPEILERLLVKYPHKETIQVLLATNMIATGVDIDRLALMMVAGQPKLTAEYIQATSRIGRKYPGLVFTVYNGTKPRDRSHYEHFYAYHQSFYKHVEPTTVTPFSGPARDRALHAVVVTLIRHLSGFNKNNQAAEAINRIPEKLLTNIKSEIVSRVKHIDSRETDKVVKDIESVIRQWLEKAGSKEELFYGSLGSDFGRKTGVNLLVISEEYSGLWRTLTSMRDVDTECGVNIID